MSPLVLYMTVMSLAVVCGRNIGSIGSHRRLRQRGSIENLNSEMSRFFKKWSIADDHQRSSTKFMVKLFDLLQQGSSVLDAAEGRLNPRSYLLSDTIRSFSARDIKHVDGNKKVNLKFRIPKLPQTESLRMAELRFVRASSTVSNVRNYKFKVNVYKGGHRIRNFAVRMKPMIRSEYDVFDVSRVLTPWVNGYHGNVTISVKLPRRYSKNLLQNQSAMAKPLIALYLDNNKFFKNMIQQFEFKGGRLTASEVKSRGKRSSRHKKKRWNKAGSRATCQMYDLDIDFNSIGWGQWIIHPQHFNAKVCQGSCPSPIDFGTRPTNHAVLQSLMKHTRQNSSPSPCCVPTKLQPMSMLYFEYDEIVVRHYEDMIANDCGCR